MADDTEIAVVQLQLVTKMLDEQSKTMQDDIRQLGTKYVSKDVYEGLVKDLSRRVDQIVEAHAKLVDDVNAKFKAVEVDQKAQVQNQMATRRWGLGFAVAIGGVLAGLFAAVIPLVVK